MKKQIVVVVKKELLIMKNLKICLLLFIILFSCEYENPAFKFSNFYGTSAENIAKAIKMNDKNVIKKEISKGIDINFEDKKYEVSLLELALVNQKKEAFDELLESGANPNIENSSCISPLISAIRYQKDCDLYYIKHLLEYGANITPRFFQKCNYFSHDPINETIQYYSDEEIDCGLEILELLLSKINNPDLLFMYNNTENYRANVVYLCLSTHKNLMALKFLIVDLGYKVPKEIFIDGTVLQGQEGFKSLKEILQSKKFVFPYSELREKAKEDILNYLK
ncbi:hypothetical protein [Winogradskyella sp. MIT101101]|uniref:hypothetical protein n=1 Tax=Winogradskyella sp. MIT101101 TaxID=3098297 RepID=UPI00399A34CF